jgi:hypothetical protein
MSKNINVYLNDEAINALDKRKKDNPEFNVSSFLQAKLIEDLEDSKDPDKILLEIEKKKNLINNTESEIKYLQESYNRVIISTENEKKIIEEKLQDEEKKSKIETYAHSIRTFYDVDIAKSLELAKECIELNYDTIDDFMDVKGYNKKEEQPQ